MRTSPTAYTPGTLVSPTLFVTMRPVWPSSSAPSRNSVFGTVPTAMKHAETGTFAVSPSMDSTMVFQTIRTLSSSRSFVL